jgi:hypothetical protein
MLQTQYGRVFHGGALQFHPSNCFLTELSLCQLSRIVIGMQNYLPVYCRQFGAVVAAIDTSFLSVIRLQSVQFSLFCVFYAIFLPTLFISKKFSDFNGSSQVTLCIPLSNHTEKYFVSRWIFIIYIILKFCYYIQIFSL